MIVDLTGCAAAVIAGVFSILAIVVPKWLANHMKDQQAAAVLGAAVKNSLGAMQQASTAVVRDLHPHATIPGVPDALQPAVTYVLDQAGDEANRLGITPIAIASKIAAQAGLANIQANIAAAGSSLPIIPDPLGPLASVAAKT